MADFACTMIFGAGKQGWSETFYRNADTAEDALAVLDLLSKVRRLAVGKTALLEAFKVSNVAVRNDSLLEEKAWSMEAGNTVDTRRDVPGVSMLLRLEATALHRRMFHLRGVPDSWIRYNEDGSEFVHPSFTEFKTLFEAELATGWRMKVISKDPGDLAAVNVTGLEVVGVTKNFTFTVNGVAPQVGDKVRVGGLEGTNVKQFQGTYRVNARPSATTFTVAVPNYDGSVFSLDAAGTVSKVVVKYLGITDLDFIRFGTRRTGRAFFVPAGRRSARR